MEVYPENSVIIINDTTVNEKKYCFHIITSCLLVSLVFIFLGVLTFTIVYHR